MTRGDPGAGVPRARRCSGDARRGAAPPAGRGRTDGRPAARRAGGVQRRLAALEARALVEEVAQPPSRDDGGRSASPRSSDRRWGAFLDQDQRRVRDHAAGRRRGHETAVEPPDARLFADLVLRESVVRAASLAYGVRRGLSPANRNRIRFEMRREVKRARKDRKAEEREAIREWRARQRAAVRRRTAPHEARALVRRRSRGRGLRDDPCPAAGGGVHRRRDPRPLGGGRARGPDAARGHRPGPGREGNRVAGALRARCLMDYPSAGPAPARFRDGC